MSQLVEELRSVLGRFIDPDSDRIGHAFPIDQFGGFSRHTIRSDGLSDFEFKSTVENFASGLVQAAAIRQCNCWQIGNAESRFDFGHRHLSMA